jgi:HPt (histidine-containing phosphotransfer) domain-containing protein
VNSRFQCQESKSARAKFVNRAAETTPFARRVFTALLPRAGQTPALSAIALSGGPVREHSITRLGETESPPLVPAEQPIDLAHLFRMTLGDHSLEREVLQLFDRQAGLLLARMRAADTGGVATLAHTLGGSARGIGAWPVARAAQVVELAANADDDLKAALDALARATDTVQAAISELLKAH